jgi:hypothetical protein
LPVVRVMGDLSATTIQFLGLSFRMTRPGSVR